MFFYLIVILFVRIKSVIIKRSPHDMEVAMTRETTKANILRNDPFGYLFFSFFFSRNLSPTYRKTIKRTVQTFYRFVDKYLFSLSLPLSVSLSLCLSLSLSVCPPVSVCLCLSVSLCEASMNVGDTLTERQV